MRLEQPHQSETSGPAAWPTRFDLGLRVQGSGLRVEGSGFRIQEIGVRGQGLEIRVKGWWLRVEGCGSRASEDFRKP